MIVHPLLSAIRLDQFPNGVQDPRIVVGILSAIVLLFGARLYRLVLITPGMVLGVLVGLQLTSSASPGTQALAALCLGILGAAVLALAERVGVALVGALIVAGLARAFLPLVLDAGLPWYVPAAASVVGLFLLPSMLRAAIKGLTPLLGATGICWAVGRPDDLRILVGLTLVGVIFQLILLRPRKRTDDE